MKKYALFLFGFTSILMFLSAAGLQSTGMNVSGSPAHAEPAAVPGTEVHDNVAHIKAGYMFVDRGDAVDVVRENPKYKTGTYTCPCNRKDGTGKCEMVFTTRRITCRTGSCVGVSCLLRASGASAPSIRR
jgi:hypothetical protein